MNEKIVALWGQISTSAITQVIFMVLAVYAFVAKNQQMELLVVGAAIANATTVVNYWLGSSSGSKAKDAALAANAAPPVPAVVGVVPVVPPP